MISVTAFSGAAAFSDSDDNESDFVFFLFFCLCLQLEEFFHFFFECFWRPCLMRLAFFRGRASTPRRLFLAAPNNGTRRPLVCVLLHWSVTQCALFWSAFVLSMLSACLPSLSVDLSSL